MKIEFEVSDYIAGRLRKFIDSGDIDLDDIKSAARKAVLELIKGSTANNFKLTEYRGFNGTVEYNEEEGLFWGEFSREDRDIWRACEYSYSHQSIGDIQAAFQVRVDEYLARYPEDELPV
jgi:hypothetical protein